MGFRNGAYATVWEVEPSKFDTMTNGRISISRKNKDSGEYEQDFSGFVSFVGTAAAKKALSLKEKDRIKLGDVDVSTRYDKAKEKEYINYKIFSFEMAEEQENKAKDKTDPQPQVDSGEVDDSALPF